MDIKRMTAGLKSTLENNINLYLVYLEIFEVIKSFDANEMDDYCLFVKLQPQGLDTKVTFHDGGRGWNEAEKKGVTTVYKSIVVNTASEKELTLYFDIEDQFLMFLDER